MMLAVFAPATANEGTEAGSSKRTFSNMALLMMIRAGASITPDDGSLDVIILIVRVFLIASIIMPSVVVIIPSWLAIFFAEDDDGWIGARDNDGCRSRCLVYNDLLVWHLLANHDGRLWRVRC